MAYPNNNDPERVKTILEDPSNRINGIPLDGADKKPTLTAAWFNNKFRFNIYTNRASDPDNGRIGVTFHDDTSVNLLFDLIIAATTQEPGWTRVLDIRNYRKGVTTGPVADTKIKVGRDRDGYVCMGVTNQAGVSVRFYFHPHIQHQLFDGNGVELTPQQASDLYAIAYVNRMRRLIDLVSVRDYQVPEKKPQGGGGGGNWNNNGGGQRQSGGGQQRQGNNNFDDDIPF